MIASSAFFVLDGILNWPVSNYDGSWSQWGQLSSNAAFGGKLSSTSPWLTDTAARSTVVAYNYDGTRAVELLSLDGGSCSSRWNVDGTITYNPAGCVPIPPSSSASSANQIEEEDAAYMQGGGGGGGGAPITPGY